MNQCLSRVEFRYPYLVERQIIVVPYSQRDGDDGSSIGSRLSTATGKTKRPWNLKAFVILFFQSTACSEGCTRYDCAILLTLFIRCKQPLLPWENKDTSALLHAIDQWLRASEGTMALTIYKMCTDMKTGATKGKTKSVHVQKKVIFLFTEATSSAQSVQRWLVFPHQLARLLCLSSLPLFFWSFNVDWLDSLFRSCCYRSVHACPENHQSRCEHKHWTWCAVYSRME